MRVFRFHLRGSLSSGVYTSDNCTALRHKEGHGWDNPNRPPPIRDKLKDDTDENRIRWKEFRFSDVRNPPVYFCFSSLAQAKSWFDEDDVMDISIIGGVLTELEVDSSIVLELTRQTMIFCPMGFLEHTKVIREIPLDEFYPSLFGVL